MLILSFNHPDPFNPTNIISRTLPEGTHIGLHISCVTIRLMHRLSDLELAADEYSRVWNAQDELKQLSANEIHLYRMVAGAARTGTEDDFGWVIL